MRFRMTRHLISLAYFVASNGVLVAICAVMGLWDDDESAGICALVLVNHLLLFLLPGYRRAIQRLFLSTETCYNCGLRIGLVGLWSCQCGFNMARNLLARCPGCKTYTDEISCPRCGVTLRV